MALKKQLVNVDLRWVVLGLLLVIAGMVLLWKPWQSDIKADRTIVETGESKIEATPDEFVFSPSFEVENADQAQAREELAAITNEVVDAVKELGVPENNITLNAYGYDDYYWLETEDGEFNATATIEIIVNSRDMAQQVQDYLDTTAASGRLTPQARFSETKKDELETQAREEAIADAKAKAEAAAALLDAKLGPVITVGEGSGFDVYPLQEGIAFSEDSSRTSLPVLPGQNDFTYTVSVTFALR